MISAPVGKSGPLTNCIRSSGVASGLSIRWTVASMTSPRLWGGMLVAMPTAMPWLPLTSRFGKRAGSTVGLLDLARVVVDEVDGVLVDAVEHRAWRAGPGGTRCSGRRPAGRRASRSCPWGAISGWRRREVLAHAHQGVVDRRVAVGVVLAHDVAGDPGALHGGPVGAGAEVVHAPEDPAVHRLEAVAGVGQGPRHDDRHRVVEEGALHLLLDLDRLDRRRSRWPSPSPSSGGRDVAHACRSSCRVLRCRGSARPWRWSG